MTPTPCMKLLLNWRALLMKEYFILGAQRIVTAVPSSLGPRQTQPLLLFADLLILNNISAVTCTFLLFSLLYFSLLLKSKCFLMHEFSCIFCECCKWSCSIAHFLDLRMLRSYNFALNAQIISPISVFIVFMCNCLSLYCCSFIPQWKIKDTSKCITYSDRE